MLCLVVSGMLDDVRPRVVAGWIGLAGTIAGITWAVQGSLLRRAVFLAGAGLVAVAAGGLLGRLIGGRRPADEQRSPAVAARDAAAALFALAALIQMGLIAAMVYRSMRDPARRERGDAADATRSIRAISFAATTSCSTMNLGCACRRVKGQYAAPGRGALVFVKLAPKARWLLRRGVGSYRAGSA